MKKLTILIFSLMVYQTSTAQMSCDELIDYLETESYGSTYYSLDSDAITQVTFYEVTDDNYNSYYYAVVQFTSSYQDYIYQVSSNTESNYTFDYMVSAGKAFWKYIEPYNKNLECAPDF